MTTLNRILKNKIVAIIRGAKPDDVFHIVQALHDGGIDLVEITINSPNAIELIHEVSKWMRDEILIGAGTVLDADTAQSAIDAGAKFIISPSTDIETIKITKQNDVVSIPGAFTPSEIVSAYKHGGDIIKVFPARPGPDYIRDILAPLSHIPLMPTGGVTLDNIQGFHKAGAVAFGIGSALVNTSREVTSEYLLLLKNTAAKFVKAITG